MSDELRKFLMEIAGHIRMASEQMSAAQSQLLLALEKIQVAINAKEKQ
jgi:hypothetical protein